MKDSEEFNIRSSRLATFAWILAVVWTLIITASLVWNVIQVRQNTLEAARIQSRAAFEKDVIYRRWNAERGGVYAKVTEETQPNPNLKVSERDVITPLGKPLTLINPAYMTRQVHELAEEKYGVRGHITSLNPIRPDNAPDPWETEALRTFERGKTEYSSVEKIEGEGYMRLMRSLITEKACLKCHAAQGYQEGDIRGGISVSVPLEPLLAISHMHVLTLVLGHVLPWLVGLAGVVLGTQRLRQSEKERNRAMEVLQKAKERAEAANKELEAFSYSVSHDLRAPLRAIDGFTGILLEDYASKLDKEGKRLGSIIQDNAKKMGRLIDDLLSFSRMGRVAMHISKIDMKNMVNAIYHEATSAIERKRITFTIAKLPKAEGDTNMMREVWINLISNAVKFSSYRKQAVISVSCQEEQNKLIYCIKDNGVGFDMKYVDKVFGVFQRLHTSEEFEGTGVGLAIVRILIHKHGGEVVAEGEEDRGATFYFSLPKNNS